MEEEATRWKMECHALRDDLEDVKEKVKAADHCQSTLEEKIKSQDGRIKVLEEQNKIYRIGLGVLISQLEKEGCKPDWRLPENLE
jgi:chromosome segregation ATPase